MLAQAGVQAMVASPAVPGAVEGEAHPWAAMAGAVPLA
jgi:hypothetical protein